jgi:hypothetical protein
MDRAVDKVTLLVLFLYILLTKGLRYSGILRRVMLQFLTDVSGPPLDMVFEGQEIKDVENFAAEALKSI